MYELDLSSLRKTLVKGVRMIVAIRMLAKDVDLDGAHLADLEREVRERAGEVQKAEGLMRNGRVVVLKRD